MSCLSIVNWERYQHYKDRRPIWIKFYIELLDDPEIRRLPISTRLLWDQLLLLAGRHSNAILFDPKEIASDTRLSEKQVKEGVKTLLEGRWLKEIRSSKLIADRYQVDSPRARDRALAERQSKRQTPPAPPQGGNGFHKITKKQLRQFTGCRYTRGTHGATYVHDPLGKSKPPADWPHPPPEEAEIVAALKSGREPEPEA